MNKPLMMAGELPETRRVSCRSKFGKFVYLVGFIIKKKHQRLFLLNHYRGTRMVSMTLRPL